MLRRSFVYMILPNARTTAVLSPYVQGASPFTATPPNMMHLYGYRKHATPASYRSALRVFNSRYTSMKLIAISLHVSALAI